jgi:hypothetical protein
VEAHAGHDDLLADAVAAEAGILVLRNLYSAKTLIFSVR